ncbi:MAG: S8 family serine peptidase, partial [Terricaulis sp.]
SDDHHNDSNDRHSGRGGDDDYDSSFIAEEVIYSVEYDSHGGEFVPGEIVFVGRARDLALALNNDFEEIRIQNLASGGVMARLALPHGVAMDQALSLLRRLTPDAIATPNNIYRSAQTSVRASAERTPTRRATRFRGTLGVIDTGVDAASLPADALLSQRAFAGPSAVARDHGSMVASIAVARGVRVQVADVFGHSTDGALAASAERIAAALDWMIAHRIAVVNISVEGPDNAVLAEMVHRAAERGHIIVAAAGNGGPSARPSFPAAFDGVLAVTAIDESDRPYIRANRGSYIDFAAPGVDVTVDVNGSVTRVSGTSFAAPVIAADAALRLHTPSRTESARVLTALRARAEDLGAPGHDNIFGWGALRD